MGEKTDLVRFLEEVKDQRTGANGEDKEVTVVEVAQRDTINNRRCI